MIKKIIEEVWAFYGPEGIYPKYFNGELTKEQLEEAVILVFDYFKNHHIDFDEGSYERGIVLDVMIQMYVYEGNPPKTIEYFLGLDPHAQFINDIVCWQYY